MILANLTINQHFISQVEQHLNSIKTQLSREANAKEPEIKYDFGGVMVTFTGEIPIEANLTKHLAEEFPHDFGMISEAIRRQFGKNVEKTFQLILENKYIKALELSAILGVSSRTVENYINKLKNAGIIERKGPNLGGYWEVVEKSDEKTQEKQ